MKEGIRFLLFMLLSFFLLSCTESIIGSWPRIAKSEDKTTIKKRIDSQSVYLNKEDYNGNNALHLAILHNNIDIVDVLINAGIDLNEPNDYGKYPLILSIKEGYPDLAKKLIDSGAKVRISDNRDITPLILSIQNEYLDLAEKLIDSGAKVRITDNRDHTPLMWASKKGYAELAKKLIDNNANVYEKYYRSSSSINSLDMAAYFGNSGVVKQIINKTVDIDLEEPLYYAVQGEHLESVQTLINEGADINSRQGVKDSSADTEYIYNYTCLTLALDSGNVEIAKYLIKEGADVNKTKEIINRRSVSKEISPLRIAVGEEHPALVKMLVKHGAEIQKEDDMLFTIMDIAKRKGNYEIIKILKRASSH